MKPVGLNKDGIVVPQSRPMIPTAAAMLTGRNPALELAKLNKLLSGNPIELAVIRSGGGIGDVLMTMPTVKALKKKYTCNLTYVTDFQYLSGALQKVAEHNPLIDRVIDYRHYKETDYDIVINLTCPCIAHEVPRAPPIHRIDLFARSCGLALSDRHIDYRLKPEEIAWAKDFFLKRNLKPENIIVVQPFASNPRRSYDIRQLQKALVMATQANDDIRFLVLKHSSDFNPDSQWEFRHVMHIKDYDITAIAALMYHCSMVVCPDSAILHLAGALGKYIVAYFGPTDYRARMYANMKAVCPAEKMPSFPIWYGESDAIAQETWRQLTPEMLASAIIEQYNLVPKGQIINPGFNIESI